MEIEIIYKNATITVEGVYTPPEPMVMYYPDGSGHPGSASEFDVSNIFIGGVDAHELLEDYLDDIIDLALEKIEDGG